MTAWSRKTWKFCEPFLRFFWKYDPSQTVATARISPKICQGQPPHLAHIAVDLIEIGSRSVELLPNVWRPFCPVEYLQYRLFEPINTASFIHKY